MMDLLSSSAANALTLTLLHFAWQGTVLALVYLAVDRLALSKRAAHVKYATSFSMFVVMAACPLLTFWTVSDRPAIQNPEVIKEASLGVAVTDPNIHSLSAEAASGQIPTESMMSRTHFVAQSYTPYLLVAWLMGVTFCGTRLLAGVANIWRLRGERSGIPAELVVRTKRIARRLGLDSACVFASKRINEAAVVGFWRPVVLVPGSWLTSLSPDVLEAVIAHELAHIRRLDVWCNLFQRIVETLLFYHPAVWWLSNHVRIQREYCCDELAFRATRQRETYVLALEQVGHLQARKGLSLATSFTGDKRMNLLSRVRNVINASSNPQRESTWMVGPVAVAIPLLVLCLGGMPLTQNRVHAQDQEGIRSPERDSDRRSPERGADARSPERFSGERDRDNAAEFKPETKREAQLYQMIIQLRREVADLRRQSNYPPAAGRRDPVQPIRRDGDMQRRPTSFNEFVLHPGWERTKHGKVFAAYDKNNNQIVSTEEYLAMTNGNINDERRRLQTRRWMDADPNRDGQMTPKEFIYWYGIARHANVRDGEAPRKGPRDGDVPRSGQRDGDVPRSGQRDGDVPRSGPRDGDVPRRGPRDGDVPRRGPRDGDVPRRGPRDGERE